MSTRGRQSTAPPSTRIELPPYQAPAFSLNPAGQRNLAQLTATHDLRKFHESLSEAVAALTNAAGDINERLHEREHAANKGAGATTASQDAASSADADVQRVFDELRDKVERMTQRMDEGLRKMIDGQHSLQSVKDGLANAANDARENASTQASTQAARSQRRARRAGLVEDDDDDDDDEGDEEYHDFEPTDPAAAERERIAPIENFRTHLDDAKTRYQSHSLRARYADNNDYRAFKSMVHHTRYPDDEVQMQHQDDWFDEGEPPAPGVTTRSRAADGDDEDDDDIAISRATISTRCPLTLQEFRSPLSSKKCPHSFEADAIREMMRNNRVHTRVGPRGAVIGGVPGVQCPVTGCSQVLTADDLHVDPVLLRKIRNVQRAKRLQEEEEADGDGDGVNQRRAQTIHSDIDGFDVDDVLGENGRVPATQMKTERRVKQQPASSPKRTHEVLELGSSESEAEEGEGEDWSDGE